MPFPSYSTPNEILGSELTEKEFQSINISSEVSGISFEEFALYAKYVQKHKPTTINLDFLAFIARDNFEQLHTYYQNVPEECDKHSVVSAWWKSALLNDDDRNSLIKNYQNNSSLSKNFSERMIVILEKLAFDS